MTIFAVLMPVPQPRLADAIMTRYPRDHLSITETQWLVSDTGTAIDLAERLGIYDFKEPTKTPTGTAIILTTSAYFGRAPANIWEWMKAKLEASPGG